MKNSLNQQQKNALKITSFYFLFGLIFFVINDAFLVHAEAFTSHELEIARNLVFLILSSIIFYFIAYYSLRRIDTPETEFFSLRKALYNSSFMVVITDSKGIIKEVNPKFIRLSGFKPDDIMGKNLHMFSDLNEDKFSKLFEALKSHNENFAEMCFRKQDNTKYCELATVLQLQDKNSKIIEYVKISTDITYLKERENQLLVDKTKAELINNAKTQFISSLSQEIRTPMSGIIGMTELMLFTQLTKQQKEYLEIINFSSSTLLAIINDILDFSRIETGKLKLEKLEFDLKDLFNKTIQILDIDARKKIISLKVNFESDTNYRITGDPLRLNQILINILKNSIKQTEKGVIDINIREKSRNEEKVIFEFRIQDSGASIPQRIIDELNFKNSQQVFTSDFEYKGLGLGFTIVKHLVALMKGDISFETLEGVGNKIIFEIPFETLPEEEVHPVIDKILKDSDKDKSINVLVAEDNFVNQRLVKELLTRKQYNVDIVDNGLKIFDLLEEKRYDIILMDIQMPVMDGLEATSIIREIEKGTGKHTPIIGITAYSVTADRDKCIQAGMDDYLQKPFVKEEFYSLIERYTKKLG